MAELYCGPAATPEALASAWNFDLAALALSLLLAAAFLRTGEPRRNGAFTAALAVFAALYLSPICALTVSLFSARVAHHVVLVGVVAPLLAASFPEDGRPGWYVPLSLLVGLHAVIVWFWHVPAVYDLAIRGALPYWLMQLSLLGSAVALWRRILSPRTGIGAALLALLATTVQMGMLGALLTFAREPLYDAHLATTLAYGMTPLADQQLAGLIMWVPAALPYLAAMVLLLALRFESAAQAGRR